MRNFALLTLVALLTASPAAGASIRAAIGRPLQQAVALAAAGNIAAAEGKIEEAAAVQDTTSEEATKINQVKKYVASRKAR